MRAVWLSQQSNMKWGILETLVLLLLVSGRVRASSMYNCFDQENGFLDCFMKNSFIRKRDVGGTDLFSDLRYNPHETDLQRQQRIERSFDRFLQFVDFIGHVDEYLTGRATDFLTSVNEMVDNRPRLPGLT